MALTSHTTLDGSASEPQVQRSRWVELDFLRVCAAVAVVAVHATGLLLYEPAFSEAWWAGAIYGSLVRWCVPVFIMLSGAFLLSPDRTETPAAFYRRTSSKLIVPAIFWTIFFFISQHRRDPRLSSLFDFVLAGRTHLWYLYMLVGLFLVTPLLRKTVAALSERELAVLILMGLTTGAAYSTQRLLESGRAGLAVSEWPLYIPYFLAGRYVLVRRAAIRRRPLLVTFALACSLQMVALPIFVAVAGNTGMEIAQSYFNPLVIVASIALFAFFAAMTDSTGWRAFVARASPYTLGVYVIHPLAIYQCRKAGIDSKLWSPWCGGLLITLCAFHLSLAGAIVLRHLPVLRRLV